MTLFAQYTLGVVLRNLGQTDEAERLLTDVLERARRTLGAQHVRTIETLNAVCFEVSWAGSCPTSRAVATDCSAAASVASKRFK